MKFDNIGVGFSRSKLCLNSRDFRSQRAEKIYGLVIANDALGNSGDKFLNFGLRLRVFSFEIRALFPRVRLCSIASGFALSMVTDSGSLSMTIRRESALNGAGAGQFTTAPFRRSGEASCGLRPAFQIETDSIGAREAFLQIPPAEFAP